MSQRWQRWLDLITPRSGRIRTEDGRHVNQGDFFASNNEYASRIGRLHRTFWAGDVPAATAYDFVLLPPEGIQIYGISRTQTVLDGRLDIAFLVGGTYSSVDETMDGFNFDEVGGAAPVSQLLRVTGLSGASARTSGAPVISPETGPIRTPANQTAAGAHPRFDAASIPAFRYANPGASPVNLWFDLIWEEREADG